MAEPLLICPGCRILRDGRLDVRTIEAEGELLVCECGRRYPIIDGVPIVLADPTNYLRGDAMTVVERDLSPEVAALLVETTPDDAPYARLLDHLSVYLDGHWGDRADPSLPLALREIVDRIGALARVERAVELGCSAGRLVAELAKRADHVLGLDLQFGTVRRARKLLRGESLRFARRMIGRHYTPATIVPGELASDRVSWLCGDALDPPLLPRAFDRVVATNLLDSIANPRRLINVIDGLCDHGGEVILTSPYSWQSSIVSDHHRLDERDPGAAVRAMLTGGELSARYEIVEEAELTWSLRRDARSTITYRIDYLRARKL